MSIHTTAGERASAPIAAAMFVVALAVLVLQIVLTRLMSVLVSHHSAFVVLALVMLGLAGSAVAVFLDAQRHPERPLPLAAAGAARRAALFAVGALLLYVHTLAFIRSAELAALQVVLAAVVFAPTFYYAGYVIAALLTHYVRDVSRLYWFDLTGAAVGCLLVVPLLNELSAMNAVLVCAIALAAAALLLARGSGDARERTWSLGLLVGLSVLLIGALAWPPLTAPRWASGVHDATPLWERWNSLARVTVWNEMPAEEDVAAFQQAKEGDQSAEIRRRLQAGWGMSSQFHGPVAETRWLEIDSRAGTQIIGKSKARPEELEFLKWDVTAAAYWLRPNRLERVFVIGGGGGRDVLTGVVFGSQRVDVVELNPAVAAAVNDDDGFGSFSGRLYSSPNVDLTIGEARSELSRRSERYDLIQMSMVDTFASSTAGALVLTENTLYTTEAIELFLLHLKDDGMVSISRWYTPKQYGELARLLVMAGDALRRLGIAHPEEQVAVVYNEGDLVASVVSCIIKRTPFTADERLSLEKLCKDKKFTLLWPTIPGVSAPGFLDVSAMLRPAAERPADAEFDLTAPTDDRPFYFNTRRPLWSWVQAIRSGDRSKGSHSDITLGSILLVLTTAGFWIVVRPLEMYRATLPPEERRPWRDFGRPVAYFAGIGLGFMLVELALIQRYILFLGHPTYALSLVLFVLLLCSGLGSMLSARLAGDSPRVMTGLLTAIVALVLFTAFAVPSLLEWAHPWPRPARLALAAALIAPLGVCMGTIYPLGVRRLSACGQEALVPWLWGVNGICGMAASVLGMCVAISFGYTVVLLLGAAGYALTAWAIRAGWTVRTAKAVEATTAEAAAVRA